MHELRVRYPHDHGLARWAARVHRLDERAGASRGKTRRARHEAGRRCEPRRARGCGPCAQRPAAGQRKRGGRLLRHREALCVVGAAPLGPADTNGAARSLRHLVPRRKLSGGPRSPQGTHTKLPRCSRFGTWRAQRVDPFRACRQLLTSPQV